jgi:hypothetical protein
MDQPIDTARIASDCRAIEENQKALEWLLEYGPSILERDTAMLKLDTITAASCNGYKQAMGAISRVATAQIEMIVAQSIADCRANIAEAQANIRAAVQLSVTGAAPTDVPR